MKKCLSLLLAVMMLLGCVPALAEGFPELDSFAAWDYIGDWFGVSGLDVMDEPTTDYPDLKLNLFLNGLGDLYLDDAKKEIVGWYVEEGTVFLARTVDKVPQADQIFAFAAKNETGRLVVNLGYCSVICEQEGEEYLDVTWPEFDAEDAKYFIGTWEAVTYISEGMELSAELVGPMTFVLKDDGTAQSIEGDEEPYDLRWYSDYAVAYVGENPMELAEISFDGNGNISVKLDAETTVIMKPVAEVVETGTILGTWESSDKTVEITEDGKLKMVYKSDGYTNHMQWEIIDGMPTVSLGTWKGSTIQFVDGYLIINYSVEQKLTRVGDVPEIYVGPGGFEVPADDASADFLGNWVEDDGRGVLTFNADFTAVMNFTDGRVYDMNWKTTDTGAMFTSGNWFDTPMVIEGENTLNIGDGWMILYREGTQDSGDEMPVAQPIGAEGEAYFGTWTMDLGGIAMNLTLNQDGTCAMEMFGESEPGVWSIVDGKANVMGDEAYIDGDGNLVHEAAGMVFTKTEGGASSEEMSDEEMLLALLEMMNQMEGEDNVEAGTDADEDFYIGRKFVMTGAVISGINLSADQLNAAGDYVIFNADGSVELFMGDRLVETLGWTRGTMNIAGQDYEGFIVDYYGTYYNFGITGDGLMLDYFGTPRFYEPEVKEEAAVPAAPEAAAPASAVPAGLDAYMNKKYVAKTYTAAGFTADASMLGAEYALTLKADGTCELTMAGFPVLLKWTQEQDRLAIDYMGAATYYATPTAAGLDLEMNGMVLGMVAE